MDIIRDLILKNWVDFLDTSAKARDKIIKDFENSVKKFDTVIEEQRQATILLLKKALNLSDGDVIVLSKDGSYKIEKEEFSMEDKKEEKVTLNGREISKEELERQKEAASSQKGAKLEEVSPNNYKMHLKD